MKEAEIRDRLLETPNVLEEGLIILKKEQYIPNELGTRGFVDIYAKDSKNHHVLIEIKRSQPASREAINEILKYVEGVKSHFGANDQEIRVIVASTEWKELIVPFSRFVHESTIDVTGLKLFVKKSDIKSEEIEPLKISHGRYIAPWYDIYWYLNIESLERGLTSIRECCCNKAIDDYVVGVLELKEPAHSEPQMKRYKVIEGVMGGSRSEPLPLYKYIVVLARQAMSEIDYIQILQKDPDKLLEVKESLEKMQFEEKNCYLHESVMEIEPSIDFDDYEIGNPAKFSKYFSESDKTLKYFLRNGIFERNKILTNEQIISELKGDQGSTGQKLKKTVEISNKSHLNVLKKDVESSLSENPVWKNHILFIINEIEQEHPKCELDINLYNPSTGLFTLYFLMSKEDGFCYLPSYQISIRDKKEHIKSYIGCLQGKKFDCSFEHILEKYYFSNIGMLTQSITWGAREIRDFEILKNIGLTYESFKVVSNVEGNNLFMFSNYIWEATAKEGIDFFLQQYLNENSEFVNAVLEELGSRDYGFMFSNTPVPIKKHIIVSREEVNLLDTKNIEDEFSSLLKTHALAKAGQGNVEISFDGYENDSRELLEIDEVRLFTQEISKKVPYLFFFLGLESACHSLRLILLCHLDVVKVDVENKTFFEIKSTPEVVDFLEFQFNGLNILTDQIGMSLEENKKISKEVLNVVHGLFEKS